MLRRLLLAVSFSLFASTLHAQTFRVPYHSVNSMILLDARVNGKPAALMLDTGSAMTVLDVSALGLSEQYAFKRSEVNRGAPGIHGDIGISAADLNIGGSQWKSHRVSVMNLESVKQRFGIKQLEGLLGQDILREFSAVRTDYKANVIEFEK